MTLRVDLVVVDVQIHRNPTVVSVGCAPQNRRSNKFFLQGLGLAAPVEALEPISWIGRWWRCDVITASTIVIARGWRGLLAFRVWSAGWSTFYAVEDVGGCGAGRQNTFKSFALKAPVAFGAGGAAFTVNHNRYNEKQILIRLTWKFC